MNQVQKLVMFIGIFTINLSFAQGYKVETDKGVKYINDPMVCNGRHWTEANGKQMMNEFSKLWTDAKSWKKRAKAIKDNIQNGMQWDKISQYRGQINVIKHSKKIMDGYSVENIALESFPGFFVTGNLYRPLKKQKMYPAILSPHGHLKDKRFTDYVQLRSAYLANKGAIVFAYDMVGYGESKQVRHKMPISLLIQTWNSKRVLDYLLSLS